MQANTISNIIISKLGDPSSRIPLGIKDTINSSGITYFSYDAGGKLEGKDRFIDEFGTQAIWLFGLPIFKKIADKTLYKFKKLDPNIDVRVAASKDHAEFAAKVLNNKGDEAKKTLQSLNNAIQKLPTFKALFYSKFAIATILTFASYFALTKYKQNITEKAITKEYIQQKANKDFLLSKTKDTKQFKNFHKMTFAGKTKKIQSFKGIESFMFNPVKNMMLIDAGITTERLHKSRNKYEFAEYAIKEGSLLFFMYAAGEWIQNGIQKAVSKYLKTPIDMDLRFINSDTLKNALGTKELNDEIKTVLSLNTQKEILDYIAQNQKSVIVEGAKLSGLIAKFKNGEINPAAYIDTNDIKSLAKSLENFSKKAAESEHTLGSFVKRARNYKIAAIISNIGICCAALGYIMPKIMFEYRKKKAGTKDFHVANQIKEKLAQSFSANKM